MGVRDFLVWSGLYHSTINHLERDHIPITIKHLESKSYSMNMIYMEYMTKVEFSSISII
jgi:hypothetical protein